MHKSTDIGQQPFLTPALLYIELNMLSSPDMQRWTAENEGGTGLNNKTLTIKNASRWLLDYSCTLCSKKIIIYQSFNEDCFQDLSACG